MKYPNLKDEMTRQGVSVDQLAKAVNIHPQTVYTWQKGHAPGIDKALAVSDYLNMDVRYLFATEAITPSV